MRGARLVSAGACALLLAGAVTGTATAVAAPVPPVPPGPAVLSTAPAADPAVLILHTDTTADVRSALLRAGLDRLGARVRHVFGGQQAVSVQLPAGTSTAGIAALPGVAQVERPVVRTLAGLPDDPRLPTQRGYLDAVRAPEAWNRQHGSRQVRVAVVDTGIDVGHPDLAGKIVGTYDALTGSRSITDTVGHGTFVAGVAAADTGNGEGVAGAGYDTSILGVKVVDDYGDIDIDDEVAGIRWAVANGADVVNLSLSGPDPSAAEQRAVQYAQSRGVLVVAAAGNDGDTTKQYPAAYPGVVAVGATDPAQGRRATFSAHGSWVTLAAPGVGIASTTPRAGSDYFATRSGYARGDGTSFAAPLVAGAAALLKAQNPSLTGTSLRAALVSSAHGYAGSGLGRGQVDFDLALRHVAPTTLPTLALATGVSGVITFSASSSAARVGFRVDGGPLLGTAAVTGNHARFEFASYGYGNGPHSLTAVACSAYAECATSGFTSPFVLANPAPVLDAPTTDDTVSGPFTATAHGTGGGAQLLVDGTPAAADRTAPYSFDVNAGRWADGRHTVQVQTCTADVSRCDGPRSASASVVFDSLHPTITGLSRTRISPNGDRSGDTATVSFALPERQDVAVETIDARGTVVRRDGLGTLAAGRHTWTWRGLGRSTRLPDGTYQLALATSRTANGVTRRGLVGRTAAVDTRAPRLGSLRGRDASVYPVRDGYRDTFTPSTALPDGGRLTLTIRSRSGRTVRVLTAPRRAEVSAPSARAGLTWTGRTRAGALVAAGTYRWTFSVTDRAGNVRRSAAYRVVVSAEQLRTRTVSAQSFASVTGNAGGTATCATTARSGYLHGRRLVNRCRTGSEEVTYARFAFRLPAAYRYQRLTLSAVGRSARTSEVSASFERADGGLEVPGGVRIAPGPGRRHPIAGVVASGHVISGVVHVTLILTSRYAGTNDFDVSTVRLRTTLQRLAD